MLPVLEGLIRRRVLLNFRLDPALAAPLLPAPFTPLVQNGYAIAGVCLIGMSELRVKGLPKFTGLRSENMAHRIAVQYPGGEGVFIWRRETDQRLIPLLGGRLFPGVHHRASFRITEAADRVAIDVSTGNSATDVRFEAADAPFHPTPAFATLSEVSRFFERGGCGFSCGLNTQELEGMRLKTTDWTVRPLAISNLHAAFYSKLQAEFDCAVIMRNIHHEWHELRSLTTR